MSLVLIALHSDVDCCLALAVQVTKLGTAPAHLLFTVSGPSLLRLVYLPPDGTLKMQQIFSAAVKENDNFVSHAWFPYQELNAHR